MKLKDVLKQYRVTHFVQSNQTYRQVTISQTGEVFFRGENEGSKIGRKRQFIVDLKNHPHTLIFIRQGVFKGGIGIAPKEVDGCIVTENMPMFDIVDVEPEYLRYYTLSPQFKKAVDTLVPFGTAQKAVHERQLLEVEFPNTALDKQRRIINKLNSIDKTQEKLKNNVSSQLDLIKSLRQSILQGAIQGKLVPQDSKDEPASELLKKIKAEKTKLIREKKIKKDKDLPPITKEEIPYELPKGWGWVRLGDLVQFNPRNYLDDDMDVSFIPMKLIEDGFKNKHTHDIRKWSHIKSGFTHFMERDVVFAKITPCFENRKSAIMTNLKNKFGAGTTELIVLRTFNELVLPEFLLSLIKTERFISLGVSSYAGTAGQQRVKTEKFQTLIVGLPPLAEQERIVAKVDKLMKLCDELETRVTENQKNSELLMQAVLKEAFEDDG